MDKHLEETLHHQIPLAKAMGISVVAATQGRVELKAPLKDNINHKSTAFGGSLHSIATLACWSLLHINLKSLFGDKFQVVIAESNIRYLAPVTSDFSCECVLPSADVWNKFLLTVKRKGKGRITLDAIIMQNKIKCIQYTGVFAAITTKEMI